MAGSRGSVLQKHGVDVAFEVVDGDERLRERVGEGLGVSDADEERAGEAGAFGDGDGVELPHGHLGFAEGSVDDGDDGAEVLAGGELGDDAAVGGVDGDLRGDDVRELACAALNDGGGGLVAGTLDTQYEAAGCGGSGSGVQDVVHHHPY